MDPIHAARLNAADAKSCLSSSYFLTFRNLLYFHHLHITSLNLSSLKSSQVVIVHSFSTVVFFFL